MNKTILLTIMPPFWPNMPPLGINVLGSFLTSHDNAVDIIDMNNIFFNLADNSLKKAWQTSCNTYLEKNMYSVLFEKYPEKLDSLLKKINEYDVVGFSCFKSNLKTTLSCIHLLKNTHKKTPKIVLGGPEMARLYFKTSGSMPDYVKKNVDHIIIGEGEKSFLEFVSGKNRTNIAAFQELASLSDIPFPRYAQMKTDTYPRSNAIALQASRGCVRQCTFCSERLLTEKYRTRSVDSVIREIDYHRTNNDTDYFIFFDSMINANIQYLEQLCDTIITTFGSINWEAQIAIRNDMPSRILKKMKQSGCYNLFVGLESGSDEILRAMNKGYTTKEAKTFFKQLNDEHLSFGISIIAGYPGETERHFLETVDFVVGNKQLIPKIEQVNPFTYYDGTNTTPDADYSSNPVSLKRMELFINEIKKHKFKYTNAFIGNLVEK